MGSGCSKKPVQAPAPASAPPPAAAAAATGTASAKPLNLDSTLNDSEASGLFMAFAKADISEENLEFWLEVAEFRKAWDAKEDDEDGRKALANAVIETYLKSGAPKQVCIGDRKVNDLIAEVAQGQGYHRDMFQMPETIAYNTLREDIFPRFDDSDSGRDLARRRPELCA